MFEDYDGGDKLAVWRAFGAAIGFGILYIFFSGILFSRAFGAPWGMFPILQWVYLGPLAYRARQRGDRNAFVGYLSGGAIATLLFTPCWGTYWKL